MSKSRACSISNYNLYKFCMTLKNDAEQEARAAMSARGDADIWNRRLGTLAERGWTSFVRPRATALTLIRLRLAEMCAPSARANNSRTPKIADYKKMPTQLAFGDTMEPITPAAMGSYKHVSNITNQYKKWRLITFCKAQRDVIKAIEGFVKCVVVPLGLRFQRFWLDKGGEYLSKDMQDYFRRNTDGKGWRVYNSATMHVCDSRSVVFINARPRLLPPARDE